MVSKRFNLFEEVKKLVVTEEVANRLGMPFEMLEQLYDNTKSFSDMGLDTNQSDRDYLDEAARTALRHYAEVTSNYGWQATVVFLALVCRNFDTRRVFNNPMTLDDIRYALDQKDRAALAKAFRDVSTA